MHYHDELQAFDNISNVLCSLLMMHMDMFKNIVRRLISCHFLDREHIFRHNLYGPHKADNFMLWFRHKLNSAPSKLHRQKLLSILADQLETNAPELFTILEEQIL